MTQSAGGKIYKRQCHAVVWKQTGCLLWPQIERCKTKCYVMQHGTR